MFLGYKPGELESTVEYRVFLMPLEPRAITIKTYLPYEIQYPVFKVGRYVRNRQLQYFYLDIDVLNRPAIVLPVVESKVGFGILETIASFTDCRDCPAYFTIDSRRFWWPKRSDWGITSYAKYSRYGTCLTTSGYGAFPSPATLKMLQESTGVEAPVRKVNSRGIMDWDDSILKDDSRNDFEYLLRGIY